MEFELKESDVEIYIRMPNGEIRKFNIEEELKIERTHLNEHFMDQPGKYAWWGMIAENARDKMERAKAKVEQIEAEVDTRVRRELEMDGVKVTEALVNRKIKSHPAYLEALEEYFEAKRRFGILNTILKSFDHRKDALISLSANIRNEQDQYLRLNKSE